MNKTNIHNALDLVETNTEIKKAYCESCALAVKNNLVGTEWDCKKRGTFHGTPVKMYTGFYGMLRSLVGKDLYTYKTHNLITNVGHAAANGRMSNQGAYSPFVNIAIGIGTTAAAATDIALSSEITTAGGQRAAATATQVTTTITNDTTQLVKTFNFTGSFAVTEEGIVDNTTAPIQTTTTQSRVAGDTTVTVASGTGIANNDYLQWEGEIVQVTSGGGTTTLTIARGQLGTTAASHASGTYLNDKTANGATLLAKQVFSPINVVNGDSIQFTHKYQS